MERQTRKRAALEAKAQEEAAVQLARAPIAKAKRRPRPLGSYLLIQLVPENRTEGGLILPSSSDNSRLVVLAVGPDVTDVKKGDTILATSNGLVAYDEWSDASLIPRSSVVAVIEGV